MKRLASLLLACFLILACTSAPSPQSPAQPNRAAQLEEMTVALVLPPSLFQFGPLQIKMPARVYCSGVWVGPKRILTAAHCVADSAVGDSLLWAGRADLLEPGGETRRAELISHPAKLAKLDLSHDLALLEVLAAPAHPIAYIAPSVRQGEWVQTMGHAIGKLYSYSAGWVAAVRAREPADDDVAFASDMTWVQATAPISPGCSGGGLFNEAGELVGVAHGNHTRGQSLFFWVERRHIAALLAK